MIHDALFPESVGLQQRTCSQRLHARQRVEMRVQVPEVPFSYWRKKRHAIL
jgi:hypothetical protein